MSIMTDVDLLDKKVIVSGELYKIAQIYPEIHKAYGGKATVICLEGEGKTLIKSIKSLDWNIWVNGGYEPTPAVPIEVST